MKIILQQEALQLTIRRLATQLVENEIELHNIAFIGIQPRGVMVAERIVQEIGKLFPQQTIHYGILDITFYRDDVRSELHTAGKTSINFDIEGKKVIFIDDVLYTGRTIRAALDALQDFGRAAGVELAVLIDRQYQRELPIQPTYTGLAINTKKDEKIKADWDKEMIYLYD